MQKLSALILKIAGWKTIAELPEPPKSVICVAPHTSNWDFIVGRLSYWALGRKSNFLMKKEWFFFPLGLLMKAVGGVPIDRSKRTSITQQMEEEFKNRKFFHLAITPEGTRKKSERWKMGFYHIAVNAGVPVQIAYLDYKNKTMGIKAVFQPTGNEQKDLLHIQSLYRKDMAKFPERF